MKYKLKHIKTGEEHLCDKVTIDGFEYYVSDDESQIGENVLWVKQTYHGAEEYANYIGKVYILKKCFPKGKEIILKDFYPKKSLDEIRQNIKVFLEKTGKQRTTEQIEENAIKNQATSGNLYLKIGYNISENDIKKVIATNNPNIDIPKVVNEVDKIAEEWFLINGYNQFDYIHSHRVPETITTSGLFKIGYNKSQETHPFSEDDMIEFAEWCQKPSLEDLRQPNVVYIPSSNFYWHKHKKYTPKELLQLWKEQQPKIVKYG